MVIEMSNKMKTVTLVCREDCSTGELGFVIQGTKEIDHPMVALEGHLIAHDLLEHVNGVDAIGSVDDELEALGGVWYCRGQFGILRRDNVGSAHAPETHLAYDIANLAEIYNRGVNFRTPIPDSAPCIFDDTFNFAIDEAKELVKGEIDEDEVDEERLDEYFDACIHYLRAGYWKIVNQWPDASLLNTLFWNVVDACRNYVRYPEYEGQQLILRYYPDTGRAVCEEVWEDEDEDYWDEDEDD